MEGSQKHIFLVVPLICFLSNALFRILFTSFKCYILPYSLSYINVNRLWLCLQNATTTSLVPYIRICLLDVQFVILNYLQKSFALLLGVDCKIRQSDFLFFLEFLIFPYLDLRRRENIYVNLPSERACAYTPLTYTPISIHHGQILKHTKAVIATQHARYFIPTPSFATGALQTKNKPSAAGQADACNQPTFTQKITRTPTPLV